MLGLAHTPWEVATPNPSRGPGTHSICNCNAELNSTMEETKDPRGLLQALTWPQSHLAPLRQNS